MARPTKFKSDFNYALSEKALNDPRLTEEDKAYAGYFAHIELTSRQDGNTFIHPTRTTIADNTGIRSIPKQKNIEIKLRNLGYFGDFEKGTGQGVANRYNINDSLLNINLKDEEPEEVLLIEQRSIPQPSNEPSINSLKSEIDDLRLMISQLLSQNDRLIKQNDILLKMVTNKRSGLERYILAN